MNFKYSSSSEHYSVSQNNRKPVSYRTTDNIAALNNNYLSNLVPFANDEQAQFERECLEEHNTLRALHGSPPLKLNRNLCIYANEWAKNLASRDILEHRKNSKYGENLFMAGGKEVNGRLPVQSWYSEIKNYNFNSHGFSSKTGHFTQLIWKNSHEMGVGIERKGNRTWVVVNYDPPGNFNNQYKENVPSLRS